MDPRQPNTPPPPGRPQPAIPPPSPPNVSVEVNLAGEAETAGRTEIRHAPPLGSTPGGAPTSGAPATPPAEEKPQIRIFGEKKRHEDTWTRVPNATGVGAIHVRSFHCKLTDDALRYMDQTINEWLDAHPQYEVKFVNSTIGVLTGKSKEPHLICQIWV